MFVLRNCTDGEDYNGISLCLALLERSKDNFKYLDRVRGCEDNLVEEAADLKQENEAELGSYLRVFEMIAGNHGLETHKERAAELLQSLLAIK